MIVNYDRKTFIVQATSRNFDSDIQSLKKYKKYRMVKTRGNDGEEEKRENMLKERGERFGRREG